MDGNIYLINDENLTKMKQKEFSDEDTFQKLLEDYPDLLAGEQIDKVIPRRWLLIKREMGINVDSENGNRWSIDHLFVDQDGIPTLVEVKRRGDTRIRREVVGQMLDYASNVSNYWKQEKLQQAINETYDDAITTVHEFLDSDEEDTVENFWNQVDENLKDGRIRLVFVADTIPIELQRIIEFMNKQMNPAEVLGLELKHFTDGTLKILVPQVIGMTAQKQDQSRQGANSKRRPNLTYNELQDIANSQDVGELYSYAFNQLKSLFRTQAPTRSSVSFKDRFEKSKSSAILNIVPQKSGKEGIYFEIYHNRICQLFNIDLSTLKELLPSNIIPWSYFEEPGYEGYFTDHEDIDKFVNGIKQLQSDV